LSKNQDTIKVAIEYTAPNVIKIPKMTAEIMFIIISNLFFCQQQLTKLKSSLYVNQTHNCANYAANRAQHSPNLSTFLKVNTAATIVNTKHF
jgi:hypothetical protein